MRHRLIAALVLFVGLLVGSGLSAGSLRADDDDDDDGGGGDFQVWAIDQSDTVAGVGGGLLYIWDGDDLEDNARRADPEVVDLATAATAAGCPIGKRPHMGLANNNNQGLSGVSPTHFVLANFASGDIQFFDIASRAIVGCINLVGAGGVGTINTHASVSTPDNTMVIVDDVGPIPATGSGSLHKIQTIFATNTFTYRDTLSLAPAAAQLGTPFARPICHGYTADSRFAYVTMQQGGLVVVDLGSADGSTPMSIAHVYPAAVVPGIGCGALLLPNGRMMSNGESGQALGAPDYLYFFDVDNAANAALPPATRFPNPVQILLPGDDTHGAFPCVARNGKLYVWTVMRVSNDVNIIDTRTNTVVETKSLIRSFTPDPKPDGLEIHDGRAYVTLRGATPLTGIPAFLNPARTPGVAVLDIDSDCRGFDFERRDLAPMNIGTLSDPHGLDVIPVALNGGAGGGGDDDDDDDDGDGDDDDDGGDGRRYEDGAALSTASVRAFRASDTRAVAAFKSTLGQAAFTTPEDDASLWACSLAPEGDPYQDLVVREATFGDTA